MERRASVRTYMRTCVHRRAQNSVRTPAENYSYFHLSWSNAFTAQADSRSTAQVCTHVYACTHQPKNHSKANFLKEN